LHEQVVALQLQVTEQEKTIAQLSKNSSNSSKPPSSDDITKPKNNNKAPGRRKKKRKIGGQPGHPKHTRPPYPPEAITHFYDYELASCPHCGGHEVLFIEDQPPRVMQQLEVKEIAGGARGAPCLCLLV
jgi:transposase